MYACSRAQPWSPSPLMTMFRSLRPWRQPVTSPPSDQGHLLGTLGSTWAPDHMKITEDHSLSPIQGHPNSPQCRRTRQENLIFFKHIRLFRLYNVYSTGRKSSDKTQKNQHMLSKTTISFPGCEVLWLELPLWVRANDDGDVDTRRGRHVDLVGILLCIAITGVLHREAGQLHQPEHPHWEQVIFLKVHDFQLITQSKGRL